MAIGRLFTAAAIAIAVPGIAQAQTQVEIGNWTVFQNPDNCRAIATFDGGSALALSTDAALEGAILVVIEPSFASMAVATPVEYDLVFLANEEPNLSWGKVKGDVVRFGESAGFRLDMEGKAFLDDFAASDVIGFLDGDDVAASFKIADTSAMVTELKRCAGRLK